jgi:DNA-binding transcriptional LysR family regulator
MELRRLRHFSVLADTLNFRAAATRLHLTQPALTRSIASLERELGVQLFDRDKRHVVLTAEGSALLDRVRSLLRDVDALAHEASMLGRDRRRELRVGLYGTGLAELTYPVLQAFQDRYPRVTMSVSDVTFDRALEPLFDGELDVALLRAPCDVPSVTAVPLFTEPPSVQLPASHRLARERRVAVHDLLDEPWSALPPTTPAPWNRYWVCADQRGGAPPRIGGYGSTIGEVASLVALRRLIALVPGSTARQTHAGVFSVPVTGVPPFRVAALHLGTTAGPLAESFVETAVDVTRRRVSIVPGAEVLV